MISTKRLREQIERRQAATLWGQKHFITPRLVSRVFGDGKKVIWLSGINTRPAYWVVRLDSKWSINNWDPSPNPSTWLEDVYQAIEEEFGTGEKEDGSLYANAKFPQGCGLGEGTSWGLYELRRTKKRRAAV